MSMHQNQSGLFPVLMLLALAGCVTEPTKPVPLDTAELGPPVSEAQLLRASSAAPDLVFLQHVTDIASVDAPMMTVFKPEGN